MTQQGLVTSFLTMTIRENTVSDLILRRRGGRSLHTSSKQLAEVKSRCSRENRFKGIYGEQLHVTGVTDVRPTGSGRQLYAGGDRFRYRIHCHARDADLHSEHAPPLGAP